MQEIAFFMDDLHTSSLYLMRLGSTDFIMRVRATSYIDQNVWHPSLFNARNQAHYCLISWLDLNNDKIFWQAELISTRFVLKRQPFSPFFRWSKKVCVCVAVMYVSLFEHVLFQLTVRENGFKKCFQTPLINLDDALQNWLCAMPILFHFTLRCRELKCKSRR